MFKNSTRMFAVAAVLVLSAVSQQAFAQDPCGVTGGDPEPQCPPPPPGLVKAASKTMDLHDLSFLKKIQLSAATSSALIRAKAAAHK